MRRLFPLLLLLLAAVFCQDGPRAFAQPAGYVPPTAPTPSAPPYARNAGPGGGTQAYSAENCGTPDEPKPCPPMPRVPLQDYPANRQ
jgi:hypothetical protein